ncbi:hypothetical protein [Fibrella arboris]|uniref:hypothetical protein n=1 Tax=Fibrella arboris TaxID=3242486 RepID=UPI003520AEBD
MSTPLSHILVFRTTIQTIADKHCVAARLNAHNEIQEWTIDLDDVDCVLRIVSPTLRPQAITLLVQQLGFNCTELD